MALTGPRLSGPGHSDLGLVAAASSENAALSQAVVQSRESEERREDARATLIKHYSNTDPL